MKFSNYYKFGPEIQILELKVLKLFGPEIPIKIYHNETRIFDHLIEKEWTSSPMNIIVHILKIILDQKFNDFI